MTWRKSSVWVWQMQSFWIQGASAHFCHWWHAFLGLEEHHLAKKSMAFGGLQLGCISMLPEHVLIKPVSKLHQRSVVAVEQCGVAYTSRLQACYSRVERKIQVKHASTPLHMRHMKMPLLQRRAHKLAGTTTYIYMYIYVYIYVYIYICIYTYIEASLFSHLYIPKSKALWPYGKVVALGHIHGKCLAPLYEGHLLPAASADGGRTS